MHSFFIWFNMDIIENLYKLCFPFLLKTNMGKETKWNLPVSFPTLPNVEKESFISHSLGSDFPLNPFRESNGAYV